MPADKINLTYADGMLFHRIDQLIEILVESDHHRI